MKKIELEDLEDLATYITAIILAIVVSATGIIMII